MPRKKYTPCGQNRLTLSLSFSRGMQQPRIQALHKAYLELSEKDQRVIDGMVRMLIDHPRFEGRQFGPVGAFELLGAVGEFLARRDVNLNPLATWDAVLKEEKSGKTS